MDFFKKFCLGLILCVGGGLISGLVTRQAISDWYIHLNLPPGTPPNFIFPIVWTTLYTLMAIALTLIWTSPYPQKKVPIFFFGTQLVLNFVWSWLFFGLKNPFLALLDLILLLVFTAGTIITFKKHSKLAASLLLPYLAWIIYAFYLNLLIWLYNS